MVEPNQKLLAQAYKTQGYLQKLSSGLFPAWGRRYFIILGETLCYYADETLDEPKKKINIADILSLKTDSPLQLSFKAGIRTYKLRAHASADRELWVASLNMIKDYQDWRVNHPIRLDRGGSKNRRPQKRLVSKSKSTQANVTSQRMNTMLLKSQDFFSLEAFFAKVRLFRLAGRAQTECIQSKLLLVKTEVNIYFLISCKTIQHSHFDEDFLEDALIHPYEYNTIYYHSTKKDSDEVHELCQCARIESITNDKTRLILGWAGKQAFIPLDNNMSEEVVDTLMRKISLAVAIGREYHNQLALKITRNIDKTLHLHDAQALTVRQIVHKEFEKALMPSRDTCKALQFIKNMDSLKNSCHSFLNCCLVKQPSLSELARDFAKQYYELIFAYLSRQWKIVQEQMTANETKRLIVSIYSFAKLAEKYTDDSRLLEGCVVLVKILLGQYEKQIREKVDSSIAMKQANLVSEVRSEGFVRGSQMEGGEGVFYSNRLFRQLLVDLRFTLQEVSEMPRHEKVRTHYFQFYRYVFQWTCKRIQEALLRWKDPCGLLGACNELEALKTRFLEEVDQLLSPDRKPKHANNPQLYQLQTDLALLETALVKKFFLITFSGIDLTILNRKFSDLQMGLVCEKVLQKLKAYTRMNRSVRANVYSACFEEICFFYYCCIVKTKSPKRIEFRTELVIRKIAEEIEAIRKHFDGFVSKQKIQLHLQDLGLLQEFLSCNAGYLQKVCQVLKKEFGNSFNETAMQNLLSFRDMSADERERAYDECVEVISVPAEANEQMSLISRESFLETCNQTQRSRKSTLTMSLDQFYGKIPVLEVKAAQKFHEGYLLNKGGKGSQGKSYFKVRDKMLLQFECQQDDEPIYRYFLQALRKCSIHPDKPSAFQLDFMDMRLQLQAASDHECQNWVRDIYEGMNNLSQQAHEKDETGEVPSPITASKEENTLDTRDSKQQRLSPDARTRSPQKMQTERASSIHLRMSLEETGCGKCSRGLIF